MIGRPQKAEKENSHQKAQRKGIWFQAAGQGKAAGEQEGSQNAQNKCADVQKKDTFAQNRGIGIKKNRNQQGSDEDSKAERRGKAGGFPSI